MATSIFLYFLVPPVLPTPTLVLSYQMRREWVHEGLWLRSGVLGVRFLMRQHPPPGMIRVQVGYPQDR